MKNIFNTVKLFLTNWFSKYAFYNIGWLGGGVAALFFGKYLIAGLCLGIFGEKNRRQLLTAWKDIANKR